MVEGDTLQVSCSAEGNPAPTVTWMMLTAKGGLHILPVMFNEDGLEYARDVLKRIGAGTCHFKAGCFPIKFSNYWFWFVIIEEFVEMNGYLQISHLNRQMSGTLACQAFNGVKPRALRKMQLDIRCKHCFLYNIYAVVVVVPTRSSIVFLQSPPKWALPTRWSSTQ